MISSLIVTCMSSSASITLLTRISRIFSTTACSRDSSRTVIQTVGDDGNLGMDPLFRYLLTAALDDSLEALKQGKGHSMDHLTPFDHE